MAKTFTMKLAEIQPSQLYVCDEKLAYVMDNLNRHKPEELEPIPVKKLGDDIIFVDGHIRALAAFLQGFSEVTVYWEEDALDWYVHEVCVGWCKQEEIRTIADLADRIVPEKDYEVLWLQRCQKMQQDLQNTRNQKQ
jgi:hypothetical protein